MSYTQERLATQQQWKEFANDLGYLGEFLAYLLAHKHFIAEMEEILSTSQNADQVQEKITKLLEDRKAFTAYGYNHLPY